MSLKPALYYTLVGAWGGGRGYVVLAVTSEKRNVVFGREPDNGQTHRRKTDCIGKFETFAAADAKIEHVVAIRKRHEPLIDAAHKALVMMQHTESREIQEELRS